MSLNYKECRQLIEDAELSIKLYIKRHFLKGFNKQVLESKIENVIKSAIKEVNGIMDIEQVRASLKQLANKEYKRLKVAFFNVDLSVLALIVGAKDVITSKKDRAKYLIDIARKANIPIDEPSGRLFDIATPLKQYMDSYMKKVEIAYKGLIDSKAKDSFGSDISLRNIAEMQVRYNEKEEHMQSLIDSGVVLVWISSHGNCSKRCEPYQGKLYSLNHTYGVIDKIPYRPLEVATDIYYTTKNGKTYKNGCVSGYNCRHRLIPYNKGNKPVTISSEEVKKHRELERKQREYERNIRKFKEKALLYKDIDNAKTRRYKGLASDITREYREYCKRNKIAYYNVRLKVFS